MSEEKKRNWDETGAKLDKLQWLVDMDFLDQKQMDELEERFKKAKIMGKLKEMFNKAKVKDVLPPQEWR